VSSFGAFSPIWEKNSGVEIFSAAKSHDSHSNKLAFAKFTLST